VPKFYKTMVSALKEIGKPIPNKRILREKAPFSFDDVLVKLT